MKSNNNLKRNDFWKIECLDCGVNADLLTDSWKRIICRECLNRHEFSEVENEVYSNCEVDEMARKEKSVLLRDSELARKVNSDGLLESFNEVDGVK